MHCNKNIIFHKKDSLNQAELNEVVSLHIEAFSNGLSTQLGKEFLIEYYKIFVTSPDCGIITCENENQIIGFITYTSNNQTALLKELFNNKKLILLRFIQLKINPLSIMRSFLKKHKSQSIYGVPELTSFAISKEYRRMGIGEQLLEEMETNFVKDDIHEYYVYTDNDEGLNFYQKRQFTPVFQFKLLGKISACFKHHIKSSN